jgi:hypothetical protein
MTREPKTDLSAPILFDQLRHHRDIQSEPIERDAPDEHGNHAASPSTEDSATQENFEAPREESGRGRLPPEARRALVNLLRQGIIMADSKRAMFETLCHYEAVIQDHLADMYLRLLIDQKAGLALLLQQEITGDADDDDEVAWLISRRTLSLYDTLLLLVLRKHYQEREAAGAQRMFIDIDRIEAQLTPFLPLTNSSRSDRRQLNGTLQTMKDRRVLAAVRSDEERFEITPVIRYVVNVAFLEEMLRAYQNLAEQAGLSECGGPQDG